MMVSRHVAAARLLADSEEFGAGEPEHDHHTPQAPVAKKGLSRSFKIGTILGNPRR